MATASRSRNTSSRPIGISPIKTGLKKAELIDNILLGDNPPSLYEAIRDANIRALTREISNPIYNPDQTFSVTINPPGGTDPIMTQLTPLQYASLKGLKGTVRYLLNNTTPDLTKTINDKSVKEAVIEYRKEDFDKDEIRYIFDIVETALRDAMDDFTSGADKDTKYGESLKGEINQKLAKNVYNREYNDLKSPKPLPASAPKAISILIEDAKEAGKADGSKDAPKNPAFLSTAVAPKRPQEQEAYNKAYDKALSAYHGERDAKLDESKDPEKLTPKFSKHYAEEPSHKSDVEKVYNDAFDKNRGKTPDLVKQAGYVGTYPPSQSLLSGNFFGFGSQLSKIVGFDTSGTTPKTDTDAQYKEGLVEFVKNLQSLIGQAKYAGYTDGRKRNTKYTTPGKIGVNGKEYAVDFGKLNTQITDLPSVSDTGVLQETEESGEADRILTELRRMRDSSADNDSLQAMVEYLRTQSETNSNAKIRQILKSIVVSQKGGVINPILRQRLQRQISEIDNEDVKNRLLDRFNEEVTDDQFKQLETEAKTALQAQPQPPADVPEAVEPPPAEVSGPNILSRTLDKASQLGTSVITGLGTVTTKTQLYNAVQQAFSNIPKYVTTKLKNIPGGISPDDPSLEDDVHPIKRVQAMYDNEFERGYKEATRPTGGTRRRTRKRDRVTKKQRSKK